MTDIFSDPQPWTDINAWNRPALALHEKGGIHRYEPEGFQPFWAVIDHAAVMEVERQHELFTNEPEPVLLPTKEIEARTGVPEAVFCAGKSVDQIDTILEQAEERGASLLLTRLSAECHGALLLRRLLRVQRRSLPGCPQR